MVADISEADKLETGESRQGMFYAARTFAFKFGQAFAAVVFSSVSLINEEVEKGHSGYGLGYRLTAVIAAVLCLLGGIVFLRYNESKIIGTISSGNKENNDAKA